MMISHKISPAEAQKKRHHCSVWPKISSPRHGRCKKKAVAHRPSPPAATFGRRYEVKETETQKLDENKPVISKQKPAIPLHSSFLIFFGYFMLFCAMRKMGGKTLIEVYDFVKPLGSGTFGVVREVKSKSKKGHFAVKTIPNTADIATCQNL